MEIYGQGFEERSYVLHKKYRMFAPKIRAKAPLVNVKNPPKVAKPASTDASAKSSTTLVTPR
jgi:hypothetical protein